MDVKPFIEDLYLIRGFIDFGETIVNMSTQIVFNVLDLEGLDFVIVGPTSEITDYSVRVFRVVVMISGGSGSHLNGTGADLQH